MIEITQPLFFRPEQRLRTAADYDAVFSKPLRSRDRFFLLLTHENIQTHTRLGLIVSKKRIRKAVSRNRVKRIIRDSFRLHQHQLPAVDVILLAYQPADTANSQELRLSLDKHWKKLLSLFPE
ncbi:MAG: ribonuclease P protein component [Methylococcales bacterium]